jgi:small conductance mechanosensitive channel
MDADLSITYARFQELGADFLRLLPSLVIGFGIFIALVFVARGVKALVQRLNIPRRHRNLALVLGRLAQWTVILVGFLIAVTIVFPSFTPANLISALGITGIAIGFAFRDIFENFLAGILILITEPFRINDQIVFGTFEGTVENIETRATTLRTYDGRRVVIPNGELFKNSVVVNTAFDIRRLEYDVGIGYGDDIATAKRIMLGALHGLEGVMTDPQPDALTVDLADSSVKIRVRWWVHPPRRADVLEVKDRVITSIKNALMENGIDLPFPIQHVLFHDQTEETDGIRDQQREGWPAGKGEIPRSRSIAGMLGRLADKEAQRNSAAEKPGTENRSRS